MGVNSAWKTFFK